MTREEVTLLLATFKAAYPASYKGMTAVDARAAVNLWHKLLEDYPEDVVMPAAHAVIACNKFPPTPAELLEKVRLLTQAPAMSEGEAWGLVRRAVSNAGYNAQEEFERLPRQVREAVGSPAMLREWARLDIQDFQTVVQSNFMRSFRARQTQAREYAILPASVRTALVQLGQNVRRLPDARMEDTAAIGGRADG